MSMKKTLILSAALLLPITAMPVSQSASAASLTQITSADVVANWTSSLEGRWRDLGHNENGEANLYLEAPSITPPPNAQTNVNPILQTNNPFTFTYSSSTSIGAMTLTTDGTTVRRQII